MKQLEYTVRFDTPAFLGDATQSGRWRTPPIKAQLRQWWRVAYAAERKFDVRVDRMREEEGLLFGNAWLDDNFWKSQVRLRLNRWDEGQLRRTDWSPFATVTHPEVRPPVASDLYLGYGPVMLPRGTARPTLKANAAIQAGESARLSLAFPEEANPHVERALWLMDRYGTVGGRSRNGWGSYALVPQEDTPVLSGSVPLRPWRDCLQLDWPHAIGQDDEKDPLIWQTEPKEDWKALMKMLAVIKIGLRTQFVFPKITPPHPTIEPRHWLSYPITTHTTKQWDRVARLPNQLRFKVRRTNDGKFIGVIFHMPHLPPPAFQPVGAKIANTWQTVHALLDELENPATSRGYLMIRDPIRRAVLKPSLDAIKLKRAKE